MRNLGGKPKAFSVKKSVQRNVNAMLNGLGRNWKEPLLRCIKRDRACIRICDEMIRKSQLSDEIIAVLFALRNKLIDASEVGKTFSKELAKYSKGEVISLSSFKPVRSFEGTNFGFILWEFLTEAAPCAGPFKVLY